VKRLPYITPKRMMPHANSNWRKALLSFAHFICENSPEFENNLKE